uniref:Uncharacterized protein n=1 Tax=Knipowitschia caucasica TaxID=637954 RepID=A0AAV2JY77_KNICA
MLLYFFYKNNNGGRFPPRTLPVGCDVRVCLGHKNIAFEKGGCSSSLFTFFNPYHGAASAQSRSKCDYNAQSRPSSRSRSIPAASRMNQVNLLLSGTLDKLGHDFPETPVSVRHSKVRPAMEKSHCPKTYFIQQPRKF